MGTACVATEVHGISELVEQEKSGLIVKPESAQAIYNGIDCVLSNPELKAIIEQN